MSFSVNEFSVYEKYPSELSLGVKLRGEMGAEISYLGVDTVAALGSLMTGRTQSEGEN